MSVGTGYNAGPAAQQAQQNLRRITATVEDLNKALDRANARSRSLGDVLGDSSVSAGDRQLISDANTVVADHLANTGYGRGRVRRFGPGTTPQQAAEAIVLGNGPRMALDAAQHEAMRRRWLDSSGIPGVPQPPHSPFNGGNAWQGALQGAAGGGGLPGVIGGALGGGFGGLPGSIIGQLAAKAVGAAIDTEEEERRQQALDRFRHLLGLSAKAFEALNQEVTNSRSALGLDRFTYQAVFSSFGKASGITDAAALGRGADVGAGLGRSLGLDQAGVAGQLGSAGFLTGRSSTESIRRYALVVGEGIAKAGLWHKSDEFLGAFSTQVDRMVTRSLGVEDASLGKFMGMLGAMGAASPGLAGSKGAALIARADDAFAAGGNGIAGKVFLNNAILSANPGIKNLSGFEYTNALDEQRQKGLFGINENGSSNLQAFIDQYRAMNPGGSRDALVDAVNNQLLGGNSVAQARGFVSAAEFAGMPRHASFLTAAGIDPMGINPAGLKSIAEMAQGAYYSPDGRAMLSPDEISSARNMALSGEELSLGEKAIKAQIDAKEILNSIKEGVFGVKEILWSEFGGAADRGRAEARRARAIGAVNREAVAELGDFSSLRDGYDPYRQRIDEIKARPDYYYSDEAARIREQAAAATAAATPAQSAVTLSGGRISFDLNIYDNQGVLRSRVALAKPAGM